MARYRWTLRVVRRERRSVHRLRTRWAYYESCNPTVEGWLEPIVWGDGDGNWGCYCDYEIQLPGGLGPVHSDTDLLTAKVPSRSGLVAAVLAVAAGFSRSALLTRSLDGRTKRVRRVSSNGTRMEVSAHSLLDEGLAPGAALLIGSFAVASFGLVALGLQGAVGNPPRRWARPALGYFPCSLRSARQARCCRSAG